MLHVDIRIKTKMLESQTSALVKTGGELDVKRKFSADCESDVKWEHSTKCTNCSTDKELVRFCSVCALNCADCRLDWKDGHIDNNETQSRSVQRPTVKSESNVPLTNKDCVEQSEEVKKTAAGSDTLCDVKRETLTLPIAAVNNGVDVNRYSVTDADHCDKTCPVQSLQSLQQQQQQQQQQQALGHNAAAQRSPVSRPTAVEPIAQLSQRDIHVDNISRTNYTARNIEPDTNPREIVEIGGMSTPSNERLYRKHAVDQESTKQQRCNKCHKLKRTVNEQNERVTDMHAHMDNNKSTARCAETFQSNTCPSKSAEPQSLPTVNDIGEKPFCCPECGKKYTRAYTLKRHMSSHGNNMKSCFGSKRCATEDCADKSRLGSNSATAHMRHSLSDVYATRGFVKSYRCPECYKLFAYYGSIKQHIVQHSEYASYGNKPMEKPHACMHCGKRFSQTNGLRRHWRVHTGYRPYTCTHCTKRFSWHSAWKQHSLSHSGVKPHRCPRCGNAFAQKSHLKTHLRSHTGEKPYACQWCNMSFARKGNAKQHEHVHMREWLQNEREFGEKLTKAVDLGRSADTAAKRHACPLCDKTYVHAIGLEYHIRVHAGIKPYKCQQCDKRFTGGSDLKKHVRIHTRATPYLCDKCGETFSQLFHLTNHLFLHTGAKPYSCSKCDKKFVHNWSLKQHSNDHAAIEPL